MRTVLAGLFLLGVVAPCHARTKLLIGQTYQQEYVDYVNVFGQPAGSSHYGEVYAGGITQGDDANNAAFLDYVHGATQQGSHAMIAISIKDNLGAGGYGDVDQATRAIANGQWDSQLQQIARKFAQYPRTTFLVRLGYEVSNWLFKDANAYKQAYNHMAELIRGATPGNCKFVYHPIRYMPNTPEFYPGDANVDYVAFSAFNNDVSMATDDLARDWGGNDRVDAQLKQSMDWVVARGKKVIIAESGYQRVPGNFMGRISSPHSQPILEYIDRVTELVERYNMDYFTYINSNWPARGWSGAWADSRVEVLAREYWRQKVVNSGKYEMYRP